MSATSHTVYDGGDVTVAVQVHAPADPTGNSVTFAFARVSNTDGPASGDYVAGSWVSGSWDASTLTATALTPLIPTTNSLAPGEYWVYAKPSAGSDAPELRVGRLTVAS